MEFVDPRMREFVDFAGLLADAAAAAAMPFFRTQLQPENKSQSRFDPVTAADKAAERAMRELIGRRYPDHGILGEEEPTLFGQSPFRWVLDPIDGTVPFMLGLPLWGTLIALSDEKYPVLGVMNQPFTRERFIGTGREAWSGSKRLAARPCADLSSAVLMSTTPDMFDTDNKRVAFEVVASQAKVVRYGGDCYAYCMLASGFVDIIIESNLKPYDIQALIPIVEGAGGILTNWRGDSATDGGSVVACGDPRLHARVIRALGVAKPD
jgi:myo-inositol-1(or 4)-monophosphatase